MSEPADQIQPELTRDERKQLLVLACSADRAAWCQAFEPRPRPPVAMAVHFLHLLDPLLGLIPGLPGRFLRKVSFFTNIARMMGLFNA